MRDRVNILVPIYGRQELLAECLDSVLNQLDDGWLLTLADDGSDVETKGFIRDWIDRNNVENCIWLKRPENLGLFRNLNEAIECMSNGWIVLLCSDDRLKPNAVMRINELRGKGIDLILSTYDSINGDGSKRPCDSGLHHDGISIESRELQREEFIQSLLRCGSINGNLTGMALTRELWVKTGGFESSWKHAADWDWLRKAGKEGRVYLNRESIAQVRTHEGQLSNANRLSGDEVLEVAQVVKRLLNEPEINKRYERREWAAHIMQFQMWNIIRMAWRQPLDRTCAALSSIHNSAGIRHTGLRLLYWLPKRWRRRRERTNGR